MNYYERFCGDYMRDTGHLCLAEHGVYTVLLDTQYATERGLPADYDSLYRICRAMSKLEQGCVRKVVDEFFPVAADGLRWNRRAMREIADAQPRIAASRDNGRRGGRPKKETHEKPAGFLPGCQQEPAGNLDETQSGVLHTPYPKHQKPKPLSRDEVALPEWLPVSEWQAFDEMRRAKSSKAWTPRARQMALSELAKLRAAGHDAAAVLRQSVVCSYAGLFPPRSTAAVNDVGVTKWQ